VLLMSAQGPFSFLVDGQLLFSPPKQIDVYTLNVVPPGTVGRSCVPLTLGCMMMWIYRWDVCSAQKTLGRGANRSVCHPPTLFYQLTTHSLDTRCKS
jgi:hypothetical protein